MAHWAGVPSHKWLGYFHEIPATMNNLSTLHDTGAKRLAAFQHFSVSAFQRFPPKLKLISVRQKTLVFVEK
jgi:hypothetical protein